VHTPDGTLEWLCTDCLKTVNTEVAQALGHADIETVMGTYGHLLKDGAKEQMEDEIMERHRHEIATLPETNTPTPDDGDGR
jgi:hypothetical protein